MSRGVTSACDPPPPQGRRDPGARDGEGETGHGLHSRVPRASPAAPPLVLRLVPRSRATDLPSSPIGWSWDTLSLLIADWSAQRCTIDHAVVAGVRSWWSELVLQAGLRLGIVLEVPVAFARLSSSRFCLESMCPHPPPQWFSICSWFRWLPSSPFCYRLLQWCPVHRACPRPGDNCHQRSPAEGQGGSRRGVRGHIWTRFDGR